VAPLLVSPMLLDIILAVLSTVSTALLPLPAVNVSFTPERPVQGHLFVVRVEPEAGRPVNSLSGTAGGQVLHFAPVTGGFESLAPMPIGTTDAAEVSIHVRYQDGTEEAVVRTVPVQSAAYEHEELTVAARLGGPLGAADAAQLARDQAKAADVARLAHATPRLWTPDAVMPRDDRVTSGFGNGRMYNGQVSGRHMALDLDGEPGDTVVAPTRGIVALVDDFLLAGSIVYLVHGGGLLSG
jgi:murein DD-endopeptidase MepM/ murein hydrolase activator NlpD